MLYFPIEHPAHQKRSDVVRSPLAARIGSELVRIARNFLVKINNPKTQRRKY